MLDTEMSLENLKKAKLLLPLLPVNQYLSLEQVAECCGVSKKVVAKAVRIGQLATTKTVQGLEVASRDMDSWRRKHFVFRPALK